MTRRAVVLAGGRGRRLAPYTTVLPKPLMPVGDRSILDIVLRRLGAAGFDDVTLAVRSGPPGRWPASRTWASRS